MRSRDIGYEQEGFSLATGPQIDCFIHPQSTDIAQGVDAAATRMRAGRRPGMIVRLCLFRDPRADAGGRSFYAHAILRSLAEARHSGARPLLGPDAKSQ